MDNDNENVMKLNYADTEVACVAYIYDLEFNVYKINLERIENVDREDVNSIFEIIKSIIGNDSIEKINEQRKKDGFSEIGATQGLGIIAYLMKIYRAAMVKKQKEIYNDAMQVSNIYNRKDRRNFNKQKSYYKGRYGKYNKRY